MQGLGSYLFNAKNSGNDRHTQPNFQPGGDPYSRQPKQVPLKNYLAGGRLFATPGGNFCSRNVTPVPGTNMPAGLSRADFLYVMRTGCDPQDANFRTPQMCGLLQIMPWPHYQDMKSHELNASATYWRRYRPAAHPQPVVQPSNAYPIRRASRANSAFSCTVGLPGANLHQRRQQEPPIRSDNRRMASSGSQSWMTATTPIGSLEG